jgi:hypothetical protein
VPAVTELIGSNVKISWSAPASNGAPILSYVIEILDSLGEYLLEATYCDGADTATRDAGECTMPLSILTDTDVEARFRLSRGDLVVVRVAATNQLGTGEYSDPNTVGAHV